MSKPIDLYFWPTPNGWKASIALEEMGLPYECKLVNIKEGAQHRPEYIAISPNGKIPAIVDPEGPDGAPINVFESGAILQYLARKTGLFGGRSERERTIVDQWVMWQMGGLGPMAGQAHHFLKYAPSMTPPHDIPYAKDRYRAETGRHYRVLDAQLAHHEYVAGDAFTIADMIIWPWASLWQGQQQTLEDKPHMARWLDTVSTRPAVKAGRALHADLRTDLRGDAKAHAVLFRQE